MKNGELLELMSSVFDVFITIDNNLEHQQALGDASIGFIVLSARNNKLETLLPLMPQVEDALQSIQQGQVVRIEE